jgi:hypothetical protein
VEAGLNFYRNALLGFNNATDEFDSVCEYFPIPVLREYASASQTVRALVHRWRDLREQLIPENSGATVDDVVVTERPLPDGQLIDLIICLRGKGLPNIAFRNTAIWINGNCFLLTPEPIMTTPNTKN